MDKVSISKLKDQLSAFLKRVEAGHPVIIMDRGKPVARLERVDADLDDDARYRRLVAAGIVRPARHGAARAAIEPVELGPDAGVLEALLEERRDGR